jgi:hypothetical protein
MNHEDRCRSNFMLAWDNSTPVISRTCCRIAALLKLRELRGADRHEFALIQDQRLPAEQ